MRRVWGHESSARARHARKTCAEETTAHATPRCPTRATPRCPTRATGRHSHLEQHCNGPEERPPEAQESVGEPKGWRRRRRRCTRGGPGGCCPPLALEYGFGKGAGHARAQGGEGRAAQPHRGKAHRIHGHRACIWACLWACFWGSPKEYKVDQSNAGVEQRNLG